MFALPASMGLINAPAAGGGGGYDTSPVTKSFMSAVQLNRGAYTFSWTNPSKASAANTADYANIDLTTDDGSWWLQMFNGGFNLPPGATITNLSFSVWCYYVDTSGKGQTTQNHAAQVMKAGLAVGNNLASSADLPANSAGFQTVSGSPAAFGVSLSASDVNDEGFGYQWAIGSSYMGSVSSYAYYSQCTVTFT